MVAKTVHKQVALVPLTYGEWDTRFVHVMEAISIRAGHPVVTICLREQAQPPVPRNTVLCYADAKQPGNICLVCNPLDREAFESKLSQCCRLADLDFQQIGPIQT